MTKEHRLEYAPPSTLLTTAARCGPTCHVLAVPSALIPGTLRPATRTALVVTFVIAAAAAVGAAADGGSYDLVVRQEGALWLWWTITLLAVAAVLPRNRPGGPGLVCLVALGLLTAWTAASLGWSSSSERTLTEIARVAAHLGVLGFVATALDRNSWRAAVAGATVGAVLICAYALATRLSPGFLGDTNAVAGFAGTRRLSAPFNYWNAVGAWAGMTTVLCLGWAAHAARRFVRAAALAAVPLSVVVSYLTYSRASLGGTVLGLLVLVALSRNRWTLLAQALVAAAASALVVVAVRGEPTIAAGTGGAGGGRVFAWLVVAAAACALVGALAGIAALDRVRVPLRATRRLTALGLVGGAVAIAAGAATVGPSAWRSFNQTSAATESSDPAARLTNLNGTRHFVWSVALDTFGDHPFAGTGAGTFEFSWNQAARDPESVRDGHSIYLESMAELGIVGLLLVLGLVGGVVAGLAAVLRRGGDPADRGAAATVGGAVAAYLLGAGVDWLWESTGVTMLALILIGGLVAATGRPANRLALPWRAALAVVGLTACLVQLPGLVATSEVRRSGALVGRGETAGALAAADEAVQSEPWAATPLIQRALVREEAGDLDGAVGDLGFARRREPANWRIPLLQARVEAEAGDAVRALASYRRARKLRPLADFFAAPR